MGTESAGGVQVIARAAQVLRALENEPQGLSLAQLAERAGLPRSTVHRIVTALAAEGMVASVSPTGRVRIGPEFARLAAGAAEFWRPVEPFMRRLHDQLGETVDCGILDGNQVRVVHVIPTTRHMLRAIADIGQSFPLHCTAKGKALLAALDRPAALRMLPSVLHQYTARTLTSAAAIEADLDKVTETGVAYDFEEATLGICAAAIAVREPAGMLLTISVVVPAQRFLGAKAAITGALRQARDDALAAFSALLGAYGVLRDDADVDDGERGRRVAEVAPCVPGRVLDHRVTGTEPDHRAVVEVQPDHAVEHQHVVHRVGDVHARVARLEALRDAGGGHPLLGVGRPPVHAA